MDADWLWLSWSFKWQNQNPCLRIRIIIPSATDYDIKAVSDDRMPSETERALENILLILECFFNYGLFYVPGIDFYLNI